MPRLSFASASYVLGEQDRVIGRMVELHGPVKYPTPPRADERFATLARTIVYQQLAGAAAGTIWRRVQSVLGEVSPEQFLAATTDDLRAAGLSGNKMASLLDLSERSVTGEIELDRLGYLNDEQVIDALVKVRGIGEWTVQMFLMAALRRLDVWPVGDLGVRQGYALLELATTAPTAKELRSLGDRWRPYRSIAAWYCWRAHDGVPT